MPEITTIQARAFSKVVDAIGAAGVDPAGLLAAVRLDPGILDNPDCRVPYRYYLELYERAAALTGDDAFGLHLASRVSLRMYDVVGYATMSCPTLGRALQTWNRYYRIWSDGSITTLRSDGKIARVSYEIVGVPPARCRQECEFSLAMLLNIGSAIAGADLPLLEVRFQHRSPLDTSEHSRIFKCSVRFQQRANEVILDRKWLDSPVVSADSGLFVVLDRHASDLLQQAPADATFVERANTAIRDALAAGDTALESVSKRMRMSRRTLQRRLGEEGLSYKDLVDRLRRELSRQYLKEQDFSISEVSFMLGFSDTTSFHRAFRRWTGMTPRQYRRRSLGQRSKRRQLC